tara:strand:- start:1396 stop:2427 length:1032 start_codon:yes stop_codon:yes gene_type:complete
MSFLIDVLVDRSDVSGYARTSAGAAIGGVQVKWGTTQVDTDNNGYYLLPALKCETHDLYFKVPGYQVFVIENFTPADCFGANTRNKYLEVSFITGRPNVKSYETPVANLQFIESQNTLASRTQNVRLLLRQINKIQKQSALQVGTTIYKQTLREMIFLFGSLQYLNSENALIDIKCVHANPERTVAKLNQDNNIILPIISINQNMTTTAEKRQRYSETLVHEVVWDDVKQRAQRVISIPPRAVDIGYEVNVWAKYKEDMDQIVEQIRSKFNPGLIVPTKNNKITEAFITEERDDGEVVAGDREDRILRKAFVVSIETYLPATRFLYTNTGKIEEFNLEYELDE